MVEHLTVCDTLKVMHNDISSATGEARILNAQVSRAILAASSSSSENVEDETTVFSNDKEKNSVMVKLRKKIRLVAALTLKTTNKPKKTERKLTTCKLGSIRQNAVDLIKSGEIVSGESLLADFVPHMKQGDLELYSQENLLKRMELQADIGVMQLTGKLWDIVLASQETLQLPDEKCKKQLHYDGYEHLMLRFHKLLIQNYDENEALKFIKDDWERDSGGNGSLGYEAFHFAVFELVDLWCNGLDVREYLTLLTSVLDRIATTNDETTEGASLRPTSEIHFIDVNTMKLIDLSPPPIKPHEAVPKPPSAHTKKKKIKVNNAARESAIKAHVARQSRTYRRRSIFKKESADSEVAKPERVKEDYTTAQFILNEAIGKTAGAATAVPPVGNVTSAPSTDRDLSVKNLSLFTNVAAPARGTSGRKSPRKNREVVKTKEVSGNSIPSKLLHDLLKPQDNRKKDVPPSKSSPFTIALRASSQGGGGSSSQVLLPKTEKKKTTITTKKDDENYSSKPLLRKVKQSSYKKQKVHQDSKLEMSLTALTFN